MPATESYVIPIANGDPVASKQAVLLNKAGHSPDNPILRGLGMSVDVRKSTDVAFVSVFCNQVDPQASDKGLSLLPVDTNHLRYRGRVGYGDLGFDVDYSVAKRHFLRVVAGSATDTLGTEREFWVKDDPPISLYLCGANLAWCDTVASAIERDPPAPATLSVDPGDPPADRIESAAPNADNAQIAVGPDHVVQVGVYNATAGNVELPINLMDSWRDEFNIKHYGGAKYVSIFEEGLAEDQQGNLITNVFQAAIADTTNITLTSLDTEREYRIVFRFRSELDDHHYVDKLIRFRVVTKDSIIAYQSVSVELADLPSIVYNSSTDEYKWQGMTAFAAAKNLTAVDCIVDHTRVALPTDDSTAFNATWKNQLALSYGGQISVSMRLTGSFGTEVLSTSYMVSRADPTSLPITIEPLSFSRYSATAEAIFDPSTQFRLIEPTLDPGAGGTPGDVYLEVLNFRIRFKAMVLWTEKGSISISDPVRPGQRFDVTALFDVDPSTGALDRNVLNCMILTENNVRVYQVRPTVVRPFVVNRNPAITNAAAATDDFVIPTFTPAWPDLTIEWPSLTDAGNAYTIANNDGAVSPVPNSRFWLRGRKGILQIDDAVAGDTIGPVTGYSNLLSQVCYPEEETFQLIYVINHSSSGFGSDGVPYVVEAPTWGEYATVPPSGWVSGDSDMILYGNNLIVTKLPANFLSLTITGPLGSAILQAADIPLFQPIDLDALGLYSGVGSVQVTVNYEVYSGGSWVFTQDGPITLAAFNNLNAMATAADYPLNREAWVSGRLTEGPTQFPTAKVDPVTKTIEFDFSGVPAQRYTRWSVTNPLDKTTMTFTAAPVNGTGYTIDRLFAVEAKRKLQSGNSVVVTFLHEDGLHTSVLYEVGRTHKAGFGLNHLRGFLA